MKIIVRAIVVIIMSCICFKKVGAQVNLFNQSDLRDVDIDNYSDNDITAMYKSYWGRAVRIANIKTCCG